MRVVLLHTIHQWPNEITSHLCPFGIKMVKNIRNLTPMTTDSEFQL